MSCTCGHSASVWRPVYIIDTPRRTAPPSPAARRARRSASSDWRMIERASSTSSAPAGVTLTPECDRSNSVMPNSASKPETCLTSAGVDTRSFAAARGGRYGLKSSIVHVNLPFPDVCPCAAAGGCFGRSHTQLRTNLLASYKPMVYAILTNMQFTCANSKHTITSENHVGRLMGAAHREAQEGKFL